MSESSRVERGRVLWIVVTLAALAATAAVLLWQAGVGPYHLRTVTPGELYRSGLLLEQDLAKVIDEHGIKTVVNLLIPPDETARKRLEAEARICREHGARYVDLQMPPETPPTPEQLRAWLTILDDAKSRPVLVHCKHGVIRTGMMVAVYQMEFLRLGNDEAWDELPSFGHDLMKPKRKAMREFIRDYVPRWKRSR